ncbi:MAG TPA: YfhO family protein [Syntrophorhabdaceae bacterium]|nr:YfhO family protein [Syntrophorhabdaceae bacterium]
MNAVGRGDGEQFFSNKKRDVSLIMYSPNKITLKTESPGRQFLVLTDTFDKRWNAYIDKKQINTYKANFLFRGVMIPPGIHTLEFQYCYPEFKIYVLIAVLTFLSCISIVCIVNKYNDVPTG